MVLTRRFTIADPLARANAAAALGGAGRPGSVRRVAVDGDTVVVELDDAVGDPALIDDLVAVESAFVPQRVAAPARAAAVAAAARGLGDPELDLGRVLETHLERGR